MNISSEAPVRAPGAPGYELYEWEAELWDGELLRLLGDTDLGASARRRWAEATEPAWGREVLVAAREGAAVVGVGAVWLPQVDNTHIAYVSVAVEPGRRGRGLGGRLFEEVRAVAREHGRHVLQAWTWNALVDEGPGMMGARDGNGVIDPEAAGARFLLRRGFKLAQVETMSRLVLPEQDLLEADALLPRSVAASGYRILQWRGDIPARWRGDIARLQSIMSTDVPTGEAELQPEFFDENRVLAEERQRRLGGLDEIVTAVEHDGQLVGYTKVVYDEARPEVGDQWDTLVVGGHRGHGLGLLMKRVNHAALRLHWPRLRRVVTGNASENAWMLAINRRLGFRPIAASGAFELRGEAVGGAH